MTYITKTSDIDGSTIRGVQCDGCPAKLDTPDLNELWLEKDGEHYCIDCWEYCSSCAKRFPEKYFKDLGSDFCENCQENNQDK